MIDGEGLARAHRRHHPRQYPSAAGRLGHARHAGAQRPRQAGRRHAVRTSEMNDHSMASDFLLPLGPVPMAALVLGGHGVMANTGARRWSR